MSESLVAARTFWEAKVHKIIQRHEYGQTDVASFRGELGLMGYDDEALDELLAEETP